MSHVIFLVTTGSQFHGYIYMTLIENGFQASNFTLKLYREMYVQFRLMYLYLQELQLN